MAATELIEDVQTACRGTTATGARCRNMVTGYGRCHFQHADDAGPPSKVLLKMRVNCSKVDALQKAGVALRQRDEAAIEARHVQEARQHRRDAYALRETVADSGTQVFGKDGARNVTIDRIWPELENAGYRVTGLHIYQPEKDRMSGMGTLVVEFTLMGDEDAEYPRQVVAALFDRASFGYVHVFVNPPKGQQGVNHTVNISHRQEGVPPAARLVWDEGYWALAEM